MAVGILMETKLKILYQLKMISLMIMKTQPGTLNVHYFYFKLFLIGFFPITVSSTHQHNGVIATRRHNNNTFNVNKFKTS